MAWNSETPALENRGPSMLSYNLGIEYTKEVCSANRWVTNTASHRGLKVRAGCGYCSKERCEMGGEKMQES